MCLLFPIFDSTVVPDRSDVMFLLPWIGVWIYIRLVGVYVGRDRSVNATVYRPLRNGNVTALAVPYYSDLDRHDGAWWPSYDLQLLSALLSTRTCRVASLIADAQLNALCQSYDVYLYTLVRETQTPLTIYIYIISKTIVFLSFESIHTFYKVSQMSRHVIMDIAESNRCSVISSRGITCHRYKIYCRETADHELASDTARYPDMYFQPIFFQKNRFALFSTSQKENTHCKRVSSCSSYIYKSCVCV